MSTKITKTTTSRTQRRSLTKRDVRLAMKKARLSREEELVLRMRLGVTESPSSDLEFRGTGGDELATKLAMMEREALNQMRPHTVAETPADGQALKQVIIDELKRI